MKRWLGLLTVCFLMAFSLTGAAWETQYDMEVAYNNGGFAPSTATAQTNTVATGATATHTTTGTPAAGIGVCYGYVQQTLAAGNTEIGALTCAETTDVTSTSEDFDFVVYLQVAGAAATEAFRVTSAGVVTLINEETIDNSVNGTITYTATTHDFQGNVTASGSVDVTGAGGVILENDETITNTVDGTVAIDGIVGIPGMTVQDATEASGLMTLVTATASSGALTGATDTIEVNIPTGARLFAAQLRVDVAVVDDAGDDTWSAAYSGGNAVAISAGSAAAKNTKVNTFFYADATGITSGETDITLTPNGGNFSAGEITAVVYYWTLTSLDDAP